MVFDARSSCCALPALLAFLLLIAGAGTPAHAQQTTDGDDRQVVDRVAAVVGDEIVLMSEVDQLVMQMTRQSDRSYSQEMWMQALDELVNQKVLAEKARRDTTISVSDEQVDGQLDMRIQRLTQRAGGEEELERIYGKSIVELREDYETDFREQLLAEQLRRRRMQNVTITPSEVQQWFEEIPQDSLPRLPETVRLSHIVRYPSPSESARERAREVITSIRDSIVADGASFEQMARDFSDDGGTAPSGGRLAGVSLNDLVPEFAAVATRTPVGEVSQVFYNESQNGYHILRVNSRQGTTVDLNHILIRVDQSEADASAAKEYLSAVRDTLMEYDVPFELMAKRHSEEDRSAQNGGRVTDPQSGVRDLRLDALGPSWKRVIRSLDEGEISEPTEVRLLDGDRAFHIVRLEDITPAHRVNLEQDYTRIRQFALQDKKQRIMQDWIGSLREEIYVDVRIQRDDVPEDVRISAR